MFRATTVVFAALLFCAAHAQVPVDITMRTAEVARLLRGGGVALVLRHGQTDPGIGDPPGFKLDDCKTQRNLSADGRAALRAMAIRIRNAGVRFNRAYTSQWCRCRETASLVVAHPVEPRDWPVLNSQFPGNPTIADANTQITDLLRSMPGDESWLLVTHQINIASLTGVSPSTGEGVLVRVTSAGLKVLGRTTL